MASSFRFNPGTSVEVLNHDDGLEHSRSEATVIVRAQSARRTTHSARVASIHIFSRAAALSRRIALNEPLLFRDQIPRNEDGTPRPPRDNEGCDL